MSKQDFKKMQTRALEINPVASVFPNQIYDGFSKGSTVRAVSHVRGEGLRTAPTPNADDGLLTLAYRKSRRIEGRKHCRTHMSFGSFHKVVE
jgi:hypothetical protein